MTAGRVLYESPGEVRPGELAYVREQAKVWNAVGGDTPGSRLAPACNVCAADETELTHLPATCEFICGHCGGRSDAIRIEAGRIVAR